MIWLVTSTGLMAGLRPVLLMAEWMSGMTLMAGMMAGILTSCLCLHLNSWSSSYKPLCVTLEPGVEVNIIQSKVCRERLEMLTNPRRGHEALHDQTIFQNCRCDVRRFSAHALVEEMLLQMLLTQELACTSRNDWFMTLNTAIFARD